MWKSPQKAFDFFDELEEISKHGIFHTPSINQGIPQVQVHQNMNDTN